MAITYCLVCNVTGEKYYGSSKKTLEKRMSYHKCKSNKCSSKKIIERNDYDSYILGEYETIEEAEMKEDWYIDNKECINKKRVRVTNEEKKQRKNEYQIKYQKQYREKNIEKYREKNNENARISYEKNKDKIKRKKRERVICDFCGKEYSRDSLIKHKKSFHLDAVLADKDSS